MFPTQHAKAVNMQDNCRTPGFPMLIECKSMNNTLVASANHIISKTTRKHKRGMEEVWRERFKSPRPTDKHTTSSTSSMHVIHCMKSRPFLPIPSATSRKTDSSDVLVKYYPIFIEFKSINNTLVAFKAKQIFCRHEDR